MRSPIKEQDNAGQWRPWAEHGGRRFRVGRSGKSLFLLPCYNTTAHCQTDESEGVHHVNRLFFMGKPKLVFFLRFWSRKKTCADWPKWRAHVADLLRIWVNVVNSGNVWLWLNCSLLQIRSTSWRTSSSCSRAWASASRLQATLTSSATWATSLVARTGSSWQPGSGNCSCSSSSRPGTNTKKLFLLLSDI